MKYATWPRRSHGPRYESSSCGAFTPKNRSAKTSFQVRPRSIERAPT